jgi:hypothetical protein
VQPAPVEQVAVEVIQQSTITIGEALEASAQSVGNKAMDQSDASAIQATEMSATGTNLSTPGGLAATAQSTVTYNARIDRDEDKIKLGDVLTVNLYISRLYFCSTHTHIHTHIYIYIYIYIYIWVAEFVSGHCKYGRERRRSWRRTSQRLGRLLKEWWTPSSGTIRI